jgi:peptidoglycan hydrolase CwlO-like protein
LRTEVEELKKRNAELEKKVNDLEIQLETLEYINKEYATQEQKMKEKVESLENRLKNLEPIIVISPKSVSPAISVAQQNSQSLKILKIPKMKVPKSS